MPYNSKRVRLENATRYGDYVNASWITTNGDEENIKFIAAQSPLPQTASHFLQMMVENKVSVIVTLTREGEHEDADG